MSRRTEIDEGALRHMRSLGMSYDEIAAKLNVHRSSVARRVQGFGVDRMGTVDAPVNRNDLVNVRAAADWMLHNGEYLESTTEGAPGEVITAPSIVGIIGDTHLPFCVDGYLDFCAETFEKWGVNRVVHIGDMFENHASSFHESDPDGMSAGDEYDAALEAAGPWYKAFPRCTWVLGNHDLIPKRKIRAAGLPSRVFHRNYYETPPGWEMVDSSMIDGVLYAHGIGCGGKYAAKNLAEKRMCSCVLGHLHKSGFAQYIPAQDGTMRFGLAVGCGVAHNSYAQDWAKYTGRNVLGCGVVRYGEEAHFVPMLKGAR